MPSASDMNASQHLEQACELLDKSKEQAALQRFDAAGLFAALSQAHTAIAMTIVTKDRPTLTLKG